MLFNNSEMIPSRYIAALIAVGLFGPVALCSCVQNSCLSRGSKECYWSKVKTVMDATDKGLQGQNILQSSCYCFCYVSTQDQFTFNLS